MGSETYHLANRNSINPGQFFCGPVGPNCSQADFDKNGTLILPQFNTAVLNFSHTNANYQSGQFTLERRMSHGLQFTATTRIRKPLTTPLQFKAVLSTTLTAKRAAAEIPS